MDSKTRNLCLERASPTWPSDLDLIEGPPERLWLRGDVTLLARRPRVAIVGTRAPSPYGEAQARRFAITLARAGCAIVSGLARGIDHAAHQATLDVGGATIAVLGSGVDRPWPAGALADAVAERGLLVSEFPPGQPPRPHHFPLRNRLISGLSTGVLVVEAAFASGSLITARWAVDQGRAVWALPGRVDHPMSRGSHRLLREGAALVEAPEEILAELLGEQAGHAPHTPDAREESWTPATRRILDALRGESLGVDDLCARVGVPVDGVLVALIELEMGGIVVRAPGGLYRLAVDRA